MEIYLPYIASVICALISGIISYSVARRQSKEDIKKLEKTYELDLGKERETHKLEIEKLNLEHKNQMELQQKQFENQLGGDLVNTIIKEVIKTPEIQTQIKRSIDHSNSNENP